MTEQDLIALLDSTAERLLKCGPEPLVVAECPNKFNDADHDDLWLAVRSGATHWEQAQYFEEHYVPRVTEQASFVPEETVAQLETNAAEVHSLRLTSLRGILRDLQKANWASLARQVTGEPGQLAALALHQGQRYLILETPNVRNGKVLIWDESRFYELGEIDRFDHTFVGWGASWPWLSKLSLPHVPKLSRKARAYYLPQVQDPEAFGQVEHLTSAVVAAIRSITTDPVFLTDIGIMRSPSHPSPEVVAPMIEKGEGKYVQPRNGVWPSYEPVQRGESKERSEIAKSLLLQLGVLQDAKLTEILLSALGEKYDGRLGLDLWIGPDDAYLSRDRTVWKLDGDSLILHGLICETLPPLRSTNLAEVLDILSRVTLPKG